MLFLYIFFVIVIIEYKLNIINNLLEILSLSNVNLIGKLMFLDFNFYICCVLLCFVYIWVCVIVILSMFVSLIVCFIV